MLCGASKAITLDNIYLYHIGSWWYEEKTRIEKGKIASWTSQK